MSSNHPREGRIIEVAVVRKKKAATLEKSSR